MGSGSCSTKTPLPGGDIASSIRIRPPTWGGVLGGGGWGEAGESSGVSFFNKVRKGGSSSSFTTGAGGGGRGGGVLAGGGGRGTCWGGWLGPVTILKNKKKKLSDLNYRKKIREKKVLLILYTLSI